MEIIKEGLQKIESFGNSYYQMKTFGADLNMIIMSNKDVKGNDMIPSNIINAIINSKLIFGEFSDFINECKHSKKWTKQAIVDSFFKLIPDLNYEDKGVYLDSKM